MQIKKTYVDEIFNRLKQVQNKENKVELTKNVAGLLSASLFVFLLIFLLEWFLNLPSLGRTIIFISIVTTLLLIFAVKVLYPFIKKYLNYNYNIIAKKVGNSFPDIKDELANVLQLANSNTNSGFSNILIEKAFEMVYNRVKEYKFCNIIKFNSISKQLKTTIYITSVFLLVIVFSPGIRAAANRVINFNKEFIIPQKFAFNVEPGNAEITRGEDVNIKITVIGEKLAKLNLYIKLIDQTEFHRSEITIDKNDIFNYKISKILTSLNYYVMADGVKSDIYRLEVINKPYISQFEITVTPPKYSGLGINVQKDNGNISALLGSSVSVKLYSSKELKKAILVFTDSTEKPLTVKNSLAEGSFIINKNAGYKFIIEDKNGSQNINPIEYNIVVMPDENPEIEIISPNKNVNLSEDNKLALICRIKDDYGLTKLLLKYKLTSSKFTPQEELSSIKEFIEVGIDINKQNKDQEVYYIWNLSPLMLAVEDVLTYYMEVYDNDNINGPKSTKSVQFTIRVPGIDELFTQADKLQNEAEKQLTETLKEAEKLKNDLEKIANQLKQDKKEISWEEKEKIQQAVDKYDELQQKMEDIKEKISDTQNKLEEKNLLSEKTLEKYMELQKLMNELSSEEMKKAFEKMQQMTKNMNREQVQNSFEDFKKNEEMFQKSIERTLNLLKRMKVEQKLDEMVKRTEELTKQQEDISEQTEKSNLNDEKDKKELQKKQDAVSKDLKKLEEELKNLNESMKDLKDVPKEEMEKSLEEMEKQDNQELSENAENELQQNQKNEAMQKQKQISKNMKSMNKMMQNMKSKMELQNQMQVYSDMLKLIDNVLMLSKEQEKIKNKTANLPYNSPQFKDLNKRQSELQSDLDKISNQMSDLSQKTFAISPEMGKALGDAKANMNEAVRSMQNKNGFSSSQNQGKAMSNLNQAAMMVKNAMEQMMSQGGQGGGMMSMMQQFQQLSEGQMRLNQMTQQMMQGNGQMSMQQQAEMQRLASQQEMIKKSLEELNKEAKESGQTKKITANMDKLLNEMNEVVSNMRTQKDFDNNIIKKQDKILSKLLDAQRSINDRDFEKERESNSGTNKQGNLPNELNLTADKIDKLQDELLKAVKEGYSKDYEDIIRKYYELLQKMNLKN
ncbi:MAG: DUF4175 family protein [bacterium]